jgi:hypothetical protein
MGNSVAHAVFEKGLAFIALQAASRLWALLPRLTQVGANDPFPWQSSKAIEQGKQRTAPPFPRF